MSLSDDESVTSLEAESLQSFGDGPCPAWRAERRRAFDGPSGPGYQPGDSSLPSPATASSSSSEASGALPALGASISLA